MEAPVPRGPSRLELHCRDELRLPCCASLAVPLNVTRAPEEKTAPFVGTEMATTGAEFAAEVTMTLRDADPVKLPLSVTEAMMVWLPAERLRVIDPPVPSGPSKFELH